MSDRFDSETIVLFYENSKIKNCPESFESFIFRMNSFMKEFCERKCYRKTARKLEFEIEKATLKDFVRYMREKRSKPKFSGLSFEVRLLSIVGVS